mgnify:CR=1 FL=1
MRLFLRYFSVSIFGTFLLLLPIKDAFAADHLFVPGEIIVKFKANVDNFNVDKDLTAFQDAKLSNLPSIDKKLRKFKVKKLDKIFKDDPKNKVARDARSRKIKEKFAKRAKRIPAGVEPPDLSNIHKIKDHLVEMVFSKLEIIRLGRWSEIIQLI